MKLTPRLHAGLSASGVCLVSALTVLGATALGPPVRAALPVGTLAANLPAQGGYGTIKGRLVWGGAAVPAPKLLVEKGKAAKDPSVCAQTADLIDRKLLVDPKTKGVRYGIAYLVKPNGSNPAAVKALLAKTPKVESDQKDCEFDPFVIGMHQDQELVLKSSDSVNHNVHLNAFDNNPFNQILPPNGTMAKKLVAEKRVMPLTCDIHPWMQSYLWVFDHPFFIVTEADGSFEIKGVPAGTQNLVVWQPAVGYASTGAARGMAVTVAADKVTDVGEIKLDPAKVK